ncbi:MAG: carboxypeptidase regulatory-like domain-containing protein [Methylococcaceae bacterium]|jgi:hypothetical protein
MKRLLLSLILPIIFFCYPAFAEQTSISPQTQGDVTFVSGGIGIVEQSQMHELRSDYNLSLLFSVVGTGEYLSDVNVEIMDSKHNICLETVANGPMLFAKLKPGRYSIKVDNGSGSHTKKVTVVGDKLSKLSFSMPE